MKLSIVVEVADGKILKETDVLEFKKNVVGQIGNIADAHKLELVESSKPAPKGALGSEEIITFVIENFEEIKDITRNTAIILQSVNSLTQLFLKRPKSPDSDKKKRTEPKITVAIGDDEIELPANKKQLDEMVKKVQKTDAGTNSEDHI